ncbi:hypothetical protein AAG570_012629 [Ranatra chinensis]|uniref:Uncharacterized protein n=1 Tax=Ranatra chinensis TaxID=642074 RepID=A0ABD0YEG7_9HEMI
MTQPRDCWSDVLKKELKKRHIEAAENKWWSYLLDPGCRLPKNLPRNEVVDCFRLLTGHNYLQAHLHHIGVSVSPTYTLVRWVNIWTSAKHLQINDYHKGMNQSLKNKANFIGLQDIK